LSGLPDNKCADYLWRRAGTTPCAMEEPPNSHLDKPTGYTIGLLHLIGCLLLARRGDHETPFDCTNPAALARAQAAPGGLSHPAAAALALEWWDFPPLICSAGRWPYAPQNAGSRLEAAVQLSRAVNGASFIEETRPD